MGQLLIALAPLLLPIPVVVIVTLSIWANARQRVTAVRRANPDALVASAYRSSDLKNVVARHADALRVENWVPRATFAVVVDGAGVSFWNDAHARGAAMEWSEISSVEPTRVSNGARSDPGLRIIFRAPNRAFAMSVGVNGRGPLGGWPLSMPQLETLRTDLLALRNRSPM